MRRHARAHPSAPYERTQRMASSPSPEEKGDRKRKLEEEATECDAKDNALAPPSSTTQKKGTVHLRMHNQTEVHILEPDELFLVFGRNVTAKSLAMDEQVYWKEIKSALPPHVLTEVASFTAEDAANDPRISKWSNINDPHLNSCHGVIWMEQDGQVKVRVLNARGAPPKSNLWYMTEGGKWQVAVHRDVPVTSHWSMPENIMYITVMHKKTGWMAVRVKTGC